MLSAVIITRNEERNIGRCLQSLQGIVEEVVVVDSGSSDRTEDICRAMEARFVHQPWLGYGPQKNFAISLATFDYVLSMDADEELSEQLRSSILAEKAHFSGAYAVNRRSQYCGTWIKHSGWYPDRKVRIFPAQAATWDESLVHEKLVLAPQLETKRLSGDLHHYSYYTEAEHRERVAMYATLQATAMFRAGKRTQWWQPIFKPAYTWWRVAILRGGWLDGKAGLQIAKISAWGIRYRYQALDQQWTDASQGVSNDPD